MEEQYNWFIKPIDEQNSFNTLTKLIGVAAPLLGDVEDLSDDLT